MTSSRVLLAKKAALVALVLGVVALVVSRIDFARDMHRLDAGMLSGAKDGSYHAVVTDLATFAEKKSGHIRNLESAGSAENTARLAAARSTGKCDVAFGLVQDGSDYGQGSKLELVGRLPESESVFFLGKEADKRASLASLAGARIGIGPEGSGVATLAKRIFGLPDLAGLGVVMSHHSIADQLALAERGDLDLAMVVIDEDAPIIATPVREGRLQIAGLAHLDVIARSIPHLRTGRIGAGQYHPIQVLPAEDKRVLRLDTLVVANGCAGRSATIDLLALISERFPDFVRHNKETANATGLELASPSKGFFEHEGPELADEYVPWLVDLMPPANWATIIMGISLLFNAMNAGHRFRLWRIDDARVKLENELGTLFGVGATLNDIQRAKVAGKLAEPGTRTKIDGLIERFEALGTRSRRQSLSVLVPMGQEMAYRYQEGVINQTLATLRVFRGRYDTSAHGGEHA
jgi:hypothetical protein